MQHTGLLTMCFCSTQAATATEHAGCRPMTSCSSAQYLFPRASVLFLDVIAANIWNNNYGLSNSNVNISVVTVTLATLYYI